MAAAWSPDKPGRGMEESGAASRQLSECSSVVDLSCTYNITDSALREDPSAGAWEEDASGTLASVSSASSSSASSHGYPGCRISHCEDHKKTTAEDDESSSALIPINAGQKTFTGTSLPSVDTSVDAEDVHIRASLDAFYEINSQAGDDPFHQRLSDKISELKQKNHLYALRSFQMAKIVLNQEGTKVLQSCANDNVFTSQKTATDLKPVPGLSNDVVNFIMDKK